MATRKEIITELREAYARGMAEAEAIAFAAKETGADADEVQRVHDDLFKIYGAN